jgi:hypothetical protein
MAHVSRLIFQYDGDFRQLTVNIVPLLANIRPTKILAVPVGQTMYVTCVFDNHRSYQAFACEG